VRETTGLLQDERDTLLNLLDEKETGKGERQKELDAFKDKDPRVLEKEGISHLLQF
jgi:hypothetical protein